MGSIFKARNSSSSKTSLRPESNQTKSTSAPSSSTKSSSTPSPNSLFQFNPLLPHLSAVGSGKINFEDLEAELTDEYIAQLILMEAQQAKTKEKEQGALSYLPEKPRASVPNQRFLQNIVKNTVGFNRVELEKRERDREAERDRRRRRRLEESSKSSGTLADRARTDRARTDREFYNQERIAKRQRRVEGIESSDDEIETVVVEGSTGSVPPSISSADQPLDHDIGPKPPSHDNINFLLKKKPRGRGTIGSNRLDQYFSGTSEADRIGSISMMASESKEKDEQFLWEERGVSVDLERNSKSDKKSKKEKKAKKLKKEKKEKKTK